MGGTRSKCSVHTSAELHVIAGMDMLVIYGVQVDK